MLHDMKIIGVLKAMAEANIDFWGTGSRFSSGRAIGVLISLLKIVPVWLISWKDRDSSLMEKGTTTHSSVR